MIYLQALSSEKTFSTFQTIGEKKSVTPQSYLDKKVMSGPCLRICLKPTSI